MKTSISSTSSQHFQYGRLDDAKESIRLLSFTQTKLGDSGLGCHIHHFELSQKWNASSVPAFFALSYRWGPSFLTSIIRLNDTFFEVSAT
jgi:hypothetical protein